MSIIDEALAKMNAEQAIDLPKVRAREGGVAESELSGAATMPFGCISRILRA